jgi:hypothetical protein
MAFGGKEGGREEADAEHTRSDNEPAVCHADWARHREHVGHQRALAARLLVVQALAQQRPQLRERLRAVAPLLQEAALAHTAHNQS